MPTPGAVMSGLTAESPLRGPRLENPASRPRPSTAPTASAASALAGEPTVAAAGPSLPAATTNSVPVRRLSVFTACSIGSRPRSSVPPRLMLTTFARTVLAAQSIPARMPES